ncbi:MAG: hypothetical protein EON59_00580 [Alphaproteobacteria bacterium]|nr:MAG: hypothetical protein EON59_00580 [Alphaproteobacteria bacterium]
MPVNWNLGLNQVNPLAALQMGMQQGQAMRQQQTQQNALVSYVQNPSDPNAAVNFAQAGDGRMAMQVMGDQRQQAQSARITDVRTRAAQGDPEARSELAGLDWDSWLKMDEGTRKQAKERVEVLGQAALIADNPQKWDAVIDQLAPQYPELAQYKGKFSPEGRQAVIAQAGEAKALIEQTEPKYLGVPDGGGVVNIRDPEAVAKWNKGATTAAGKAPPPPPGFVIDGGPASAPATFQP